MESYKSIPIYVYNKLFTARFSDRCQWRDSFWTDRKGGLTSYIDGAETKKNALKLECIAMAQGRGLALALSRA
jgi:hypothetical protein